MINIESNVPYDALIHGWLEFHHADLHRLVESSHRYERAYLAWETVRQSRNPFFHIGTGFEGYFVGIYQSLDEMTAGLLNIGHEMLMSNFRLYRHEYIFRANLLKALEGECNDARMVAVWAAVFGAALGKLRCNLDYNQLAYRFQNETYWRVYGLPFIDYRACNHHIEQKYALGQFSGNGSAKPDFCLNMLKPSDYDAGLVVSTIGAFGHPLLRAYLQEQRQF